MFHIGPYRISGSVVLAPMAGITDQPFRQLCRRLGAALVVSEMVTSDTRLWHTRKSSLRLNHSGEPEPRAVQIAGNDPAQMAEAARLNQAMGAQIIDINMGCPAKKVCNRAAGSALMRDEALVREIVHAVVDAVEIPVTLKIRTGWSPEQRNGLEIARIAEDAGIQALAVHGRTRACKFGGQAEYDSIAAIKAAVSIPVIANGDITGAEKARQVLEHTGADAVMVGRAAQGRPWIFREIEHYLRTGEQLAPPSLMDLQDLMLEHLEQLYLFYGDYMGVRIARKHVGWYLTTLPGGPSARREFNGLQSPSEQREQIAAFFERLHNGEDIAA